MTRSAAFIVVFMASTVPAFAHHGAGTFDLTKSVTYTGKLTKIELINPHSWLYFDVTDANGRVSHHRCEMRSVHVLRRSGWTKELFPVGQGITVEAAPDRADPNSCYLNTIKFDNGSHMDRYGQYVKAPEGGIREVRGPVVVPNTARAPRRPTGEPNISGDWAAEQVVMVDPRGTGGGLVPLGQPERVQARRTSGRRRRTARRRGANRAPALRRHRADRARRTGGGELQAGGQSALPLRDHQHRLRLDVRRTGEPDHAEQGHHPPPVRTDGAQADDRHEPEGASGEHQADPRRSLDRPVGRRCAGGGHRRFHAGRVERRRYATATSCTSSSASRSIRRR